jgi:hypothetical protein
MSGGCCRCCGGWWLLMGTWTGAAITTEEEELLQVESLVAIPTPVEKKNSQQHSLGTDDFLWTYDSLWEEVHSQAGTTMQNCEAAEPLSSPAVEVAWTSSCSHDDLKENSVGSARGAGRLLFIFRGHMVVHPISIN